MKKIGFYSGSFDPFTTGHLLVVKKASVLFDELIIGIGDNFQKNRRFEKDIMKQAIEKVLMREQLSEKVKVVSYSTLTVDIALDYKTTFLVRGIRNGMDYAYEENIASTNQELSALDTIYIRAGKLGNISSSMVMELLHNHKDVSKYLPPEILEAIVK